MNIIKECENLPDHPHKQPHFIKNVKIGNYVK